MSFRTRITLLTSGLVFAVTAVTLASILTLADQVLRRELGNQLLTLATTAALMIDGDKHAALRRPEQMASPEYKSIKGLLIRLQRANTDRHVKYIYTMVRSEKPGTYRFVVDSDEGSEGAKLGDEYDASKLPEMLSAFNGPVAESDFSRDKWGLSLSAYAPVYDGDGLPVAIVGVDAEVAGLEAMRRGVLGRLGVSLFVGLVLAFGAGLYSARTLAGPLDELVAATDRVSRGDYARQFAILAPSEFARVSEALNRMLAGLKERDLMRSTFERYVSRPVAEQILREPGRVILAGEHRTITVLFSDLRGFRWHTEHMSPEEVLKLLNEYFARMIDVVFAHEGTLDKFVGDGVMCLFGAPIEKEDDAVRAVRAGVAMQREVGWINAGRRSAGQAEIKIAIGIHTGPVVAGNIGSERRLEYSVVGDTVNLAGRVQDEASEGEILITQATWDLVKPKVACVELDPRAIKGREDPVALFRVLGMRVRSDAPAPEQEVRLRPGLPVPIRCRAGNRADAGRVADVREDGATLLSAETLPATGIWLEVDLPGESGGRLEVGAERAWTEELDPVEPGLRYVHQLRFKGLDEGDRKRLTRGLWKAAVATASKAGEGTAGPSVAGSRDT